MVEKDFAQKARIIGLLGLTALLLGCSRNNAQTVARTDTPEDAPKKVYPFDTTRGCYRDSIVNGTTVNQINPLKNHVVMVLSRFQKSVDGQMETLSTMCTGTLIGPNTVLTAAHCFPKNLISTQIIASINLFCSSGFNRQLVYQAQKIDIHPDYRLKEGPSTSSPDYDIATIQFEGLLPNDYSPIALKKVDVLSEMSNTSSQMIMIGYGRTQTNDDTLPELRYVTKTWDRLVLTKDSMNLIDRLGLVGINQMDAQGGCSGDSGGPLLIAENGQYKILGVASYIESPSETQLCEQGQIFYSYVPAYWDWISRQLP